MPTKPNVLIFGGVDLLVGALAKQLIPPLPAEPLISHLRVVDKYSINPPTTYITNHLLDIFQSRRDIVEYRQANLTNPAVVSKAFNDPTPNGLPYTYIIDSTGELFPDRPLEIYIRDIFDISMHIARTSAAQLARHPGSIKAHIRVAAPFYEHKKDRKRYKEVDPEGWRPDGLRGVWWHEMLRAVGSVQGLPLVVLRSGLTYGEGFFRFEAVGFILLGLVYLHLGQEMKLLWSPDLPKNLVNIVDFAGVVWKAAEWMSTKSRSEANALAGAPLPPSGHASVTTANAPDVIPREAGAVTVPVFNVVDESDATQGSVAKVVGSVFGIKVEFPGMLRSLLAGMKLSEITESANVMHLEAWNEIILNSKPPVPSTPLSPYMPQHMVEEHGVGMDSGRIKSVLGYEYRYPRFDERAVRDYIDWCRSEGIWPETDLYSAD